MDVRNTTFRCPHYVTMHVFSLWKNVLAEHNRIMKICCDILCAQNAVITIRLIYDSQKAEKYRFLWL